VAEERRKPTTFPNPSLEADRCIVTFTQEGVALQGESISSRGADPKRKKVKTQGRRGIKGA
jgi:hypothetical protein